MIDSCRGFLFGLGVTALITPPLCTLTHGIYGIYSKNGLQKTEKFIRQDRTDAFVDKNFKLLRVMAASTTAFYKALFYAIRALTHRDAQMRKHYLLHTYAQDVKGGQRIQTYMQCGDELVDFSVNPRIDLSLSKSAEQSGVEVLKKEFGGERVDSLMQNMSVEDRAQIHKNMVLSTGGNCLGICEEFVALYFQRIQSGLSSLQAVKSIAHQFADQVSDQAKLYQLFSETLGHETFFLKNMGLRISRDIKSYYCSHNSFEHTVAALPNGVYFGILRYTKNAQNGHMIVVIKTAEGKHVFFDPNIGTFIVNPSELADKFRLSSSRLGDKFEDLRVQWCLVTPANGQADRQEEKWARFKSDLFAKKKIVP